MDAELKAKWIAALRSGEYKQAARILRSFDGQKHCCLGVLCAVMGKKDGWEEDSQSISSQELRDAGVYIEGERNPDRNPAVRLAMMNDQGKSFAEIADYIEQHIPADAKE